MTARYNHTGQAVRDLAVTRRFYEECFGFECALELPITGPQSATLLRLPDPVELDVVYLRKDGFVLELLSYRAPGPAVVEHTRVMNEPGLTHVSLTVDDMAAACDAVRRLGGEVLEDTRLDAAVMVRDPDGQLVELLGPGNMLREALYGPEG